MRKVKKEISVREVKLSPHQLEWVAKRVVDVMKSRISESADKLAKKLVSNEFHDILKQYRELNGRLNEMWREMGVLRSKDVSETAKHLRNIANEFLREDDE